MLDVLSLIYILVYAASGFCAARFVLPKDRFLKQLAMGIAFGMVMLLWLPVLPAFLMGFNIAAQLIGLAMAVGVGVLLLVLGNKKGAKTGGFKFKEELPVLLACLPIIAVGTALMCNHYIVPASDGSLHVGQCTYGDLCMHLGFITSISVQKTFPPMYSILPDTRLGYPFLCDSVSSTFYTLGADLRFAATLPSVYALISVVLGVWFLFEDWFKSKSAAALGTYLFFICGGFGFWYFFDNAKTLSNLATPDAWANWFKETLGVSASVTNVHPVDMEKMLMEGWYKTPTNFVDNGLRWVNTIADMLLPQRATLFGWSLLFPALMLLRRAAIDKEKRLFIPLGIVAGAMPLVHTHSFFALGLLSTVLLVSVAVMQLVKKADADEKKEGRKTVLFFLLYGLIAVALAAPQLFGFTFRQSSAGGFLKWHFNWCNESDSWLWFYVKNMGFIFLLMFPAFIAAKKETKIFYGGTFLIWALSEFVVFQPNTYDNNKLLFVWFALTCGIVADFIVSVWRRLREPTAREAEQGMKRAPLMKRIGCGAVFVMLTGSMMISGVMTLAREYVSADHIGIKDGRIQNIESGYQSVSPDLVRAADWITENTANDATFLTATNHNNAVAMLTGRNIVCGAPTFLYFHGVNYQERYARVKQMYENPSQFFERYAKEYGVDYVLVSPWERSNYSVDMSYFDKLSAVYRDGGVVIYRVNGR